MFCDSWQKIRINLFVSQECFCVEIMKKAFTYEFKTFKDQLAK